MFYVKLDFNIQTSFHIIEYQMSLFYLPSRKIIKIPRRQNLHSGRIDLLSPPVPGLGGSGLAASEESESGAAYLSLTLSQ